MSAQDDKAQPGIEAAPAQSADATILTDAELDGVAGGGKSNTVSQMGETESLRLQMAMDRLSKFAGALSTILKKSSDTSATITSNLK